MDLDLTLFFLARERGAMGGAKYFSLTLLTTEAIKIETERKYRARRMGPPGGDRSFVIFRILRKSRASGIDSPQVICSQLTSKIYYN